MYMRAGGVKTHFSLFCPLHSTDGIYIDVVTVLEAIQRSADFLAKKGVDSPRLQAELLLAHVLRLKRMQLYLNFERSLTPGEVEVSRELVKRRGQREPLQYILGSASFCGLEIRLNRHVLVPRPETELLAEEGWKFLQGLAASRAAVAGVSGLSALDLGTGSGCLAVALAVKCPGAIVTAVDISSEALPVAAQNARNNGTDERVRFVAGDGFGAVPPGSRFDLVVSNPPYIPTAEIASLEPEVRDHEPRQALDGGVDGLDLYRRLAAEGAGYLAARGKIMLEFGDGQAAAIQRLFEDQNWIVERIVEDYTGRQRILIASHG